MTPSSAAANVRIVSYNVLSSHLASPSHFTTLNPDHLDAKKRLPVVLQKLDAQIQVEDQQQQQSIVCLQEVSYEWAGSLHAYFAKHNYHFVTALYGKKFNNYMGVGIAVPLQKYKVLDVDIVRLSDKREGGWPRPPKNNNAGLFSRLVSKVHSTIRRLLELVKLLPDAKQLEWDDPWNIAEYRSNALVTMKLQDIQSEKCFAVGNYHMPCCFYAPQVMTLHVDLAARRVQKLAAQSSMPFILAGDFNIKPDSSQYRLMTTGQMDKGDPEWPCPRHGTTWEPTAKPMASAYRLAEGKEPNFTNYARVGEQEPFIDTLDYIFLSRDTETNENVKSKWTVKGVQSLPHRDEAGGPFPNLDHGEPSDHILIAADLELK